jgi:hypothetical protein
MSDGVKPLNWLRKGVRNGNWRLNSLLYLKPSCRIGNALNNRLDLRRQLSLNWLLNWLLWLNARFGLYWLGAWLSAGLGLSLEWLV